MNERMGLMLLVGCAALSACSNKAQEQAEAARLRASDLVRAKAKPVEA